MTITARHVALWLIVVALGAVLGGGIFAARHWSSPVPGAGVSPERAAEVPATVSISAPVSDFLTFARTPLDEGGQAGPEHIATGLRTLAGALDSQDIGGDELALDLRVAAAHVLLQPASPDTAALVRSLALRTAQALASPPAGSAVTPRAEAVSATRSLVQQQRALQEFFAAAGMALAAQQAEHHG